MEALEIKVSAAQITGSLTIGQLPDTVAETSDIPTKVSELTNDSGYQNRTGVVSIIDGRITADYVEGLSCEFVDGKIGGWIIRDVFLKSDGAETGVYCGIYSGNYATDKYYTTNKPSLVTPGTYSNGRFYAGAPSSERISQSKFTVLDDGSLYAEAAKITGEINADSGRIGSWYINDGVVRSTSGVYGSYSYTTTGTDLRTVTGYAFTALTSVGIRYYIKASNDFTSETLAIVTNLSTSTGTPGGSSGGSILL